MLGDTRTAALVGRRGSDRLALPAPVRLARLLRRAARHAGARPLAASGPATRRGHDPPLRRTTRSSSRPPTRPTPASCGSPTSCRSATAAPTSCAAWRASRAPCGCGTSGWCGSPTGRSGPGSAATDGPGGPDDKVITAVAGPDMLVLRGTRLPHAHDGHHVDEFDVAEGESCTFSTTWAPRTSPIRAPLDIDARIVETIARSERVGGPVRLRRGRTASRRPVAARAAAADPLRHRRHRGRPDHQPARRTSAASATGTTASAGCATRRSPSRRCSASGYVEETRLWRDWLLRAVAGDPEDMQIMYARRRRPATCPSASSGTCPGTPASRPVRIGNAAVDQRQTDVLGEVMIALADGARPRARGVRRRPGACSARSSTTSPQHWEEPDNGLWEIRGPLRHFTHSRVMVWAAFDRAIRGVEKHGLDGPGRAVARAARPGARRGPDQGLRRGAQHLHPALRHRRGRRLAAAHPHRSGSCRRTTPRCSAPSPPSSRT